MAEDLDVLTLAEAKEAVNLTGTIKGEAELIRWTTAVSLRLDELVGPVVRRSVTDELDGGDRQAYLSTYPVHEVASVTEYDRSGVDTALTQETNAAKPDDGWRLPRYSVNSTLYGNELQRRAAGHSTDFAEGEGNVVVTYTAGRFESTADVDQRFKEAAGLMLRSVWRSEQESTGQVGEFDVPMLSFPKVVVPKAVRDMFPGELQDHYL